MSKTQLKTNKKNVKALISHGFRKPYQVIVDHSFVALMNRLPNAFVQIQNALKGEIKMFIPKCEYEKRPVNKKGRDSTGQCEIIKCSHDPEVSCFESLIKEDNKHHYILGSAAPDLIARYGSNKAVPLLRIKNSTVSIDLGGMVRITQQYRAPAAGQKEIEALQNMFGGDSE